MNDLLIQLSIVIAIGVGLFFAARFSRRRHEKVYGSKPLSEKIRLAIIFIVTMVAMLSITVVWPASNILYNGAVLIFGFIGVLSAKPSLLKDVMYSAVISSFIAIFVGWAVHGM